jgi:hypothetical protein
MKALASIILGIAVGWAVIHANSLMPSQIEQFIGNAVAANKPLRNITEFIYAKDIASRSLHWWTLAFSISAPPLIIVALISNLAAKLIGNSKAVAYASLVYPASMSAGAFYAAQRVYEVNPPYGAYLLDSASQQASLYTLDASSFLLFYYLIYALLNRHTWQRA